MHAVSSSKTMGMPSKKFKQKTEPHIAFHRVFFITLRPSEYFHRALFEMSFGLTWSIISTFIFTFICLLCLNCTWNTVASFSTCCVSLLAPALQKRKEKHRLYWSVLVRERDFQLPWYTEMIVPCMHNFPYSTRSFHGLVARWKFSTPHVMPCLAQGEHRRAGLCVRGWQTGLGWRGGPGEKLIYIVNSRCRTRFFKKNVNRKLPYLFDYAYYTAG